MSTPKPMPALPDANGGSEWAWFAGEALTALLIRLPEEPTRPTLKRATDAAALAADLLMVEYRQRYR